jgi:hypothetical protein
MTIDWENRSETCDFWVGVFPDEDAFSEYVGESPDWYLDGSSENGTPLSKFIGDQGKQWYDHDMIEMGFNGNAKTVAELVAGYSYSDQYAEELSRRAGQAGLSKVNAFLFIRGGEIRKPRSVTTADFDFRYVGQITYRI